MVVLSSHRLADLADVCDSYAICIAGASPSLMQVASALPDNRWQTACGRHTWLSPAWGLRDETSRCPDRGGLRPLLDGPQTGGAGQSPAVRRRPTFGGGAPPATVCTKLE